MYRPPIRLSSPAIRHVSVTIDALIIWGCGLLAYLSPYGELAQQPVAPAYKLIVLVASLLLPVLLSSLHQSWRVNDLGVLLRSVALAWLGTLLMILVVLFFSKLSAEFSRLWFITWGSSVLAGLLLQRLVVYASLRWLRTRGYNYKTLVLVGKGASSEHVQHALAQSAWSGLRLTASLEPAELAPWMAEQAKLGKDASTSPDEVWLCLPLSDEEGIKVSLDALRFSTANIRLAPDLFALKLINHGISEVVGIPMLDLSASPITGAMRVFKAVQDYLVASLILVLISPLMLAIALAIKLTSPGPVLYKQCRDGWNGKRILVYKFRSMVVHQESGAQVTQAQKNDSRITPLGAFLRRTSLDELPQFINVLQGRMSVVGPRPHAVVHNDHYKELVPRYMLRHKVKPGITGWAQINGFRGETDTLEKMEKRVEYDLYYIENLSMWLDLKIIFTTLFKGFLHKNAY